MKSSSILKTIAIVLLLCLQLSALFAQSPNTYYIDPTPNGQGDDSNNGTTINTPWETLTNLSWVAGDVYLIKRGTTISLSSPLTIGADNITIGAYDVGNKPQILSSSTTSIILINNKNNIHIENLYLLCLGLNTTDKGIHITGFSTNTITVDKCIISGANYGIYAISGDGLKITSCIIDDPVSCNVGISLHNYNHIEINECNINTYQNGINAEGLGSIDHNSGLNIRDCNIQTVVHAIFTEYYDDITINDCFIESGGSGITVLGAENSEILECEITSVSGIQIGLYSESIDVSRCTITQIFQSTSSYQENQCISIQSTQNFNIAFNNLYCTPLAQDGLFYAMNCTGDNNNFHDNICIGTTNLTSCVTLGNGYYNVYNNWLEGSTNGILSNQTNFTSAKVHHNIIKDCSESGIYFNGGSIGYSAYIYHNTVYIENNSSNYAALKLDGTQGCNAWINNNIFYLGVQSGKVYDFSSLNSVTASYNAIPEEFLNYITCGLATYSTLIAYENSQYGSPPTIINSVGTSPFISATPTTAEDFTLIPTSNCIDEGISLSDYKSDYFGHYIPAGIPPIGSTGVDIGAIEYYAPEETDFVNNSPAGWYFATDDIVNADLNNFDFKHKKGNIYQKDVSSGNPELVNLRGVILWGIESGSISGLSLDNYGIDDLLNKIKSLGYNTIRLCYPVDVIVDQMSNASQTIPLSEVNANLLGNSIFFSAPNTPKTIYQALVEIIDRCNNPAIDLNVVLSLTGIEATNDIGLWYSSTYSITETDYLESLFYMAENLQQNNIVGISLINEPFEAKWDGSGDVDDFRRFAQTAGINIRAINPDWLVFVEGVKEHGSLPKVSEEVEISEYYSTSLGTTNNSSDNYGNAESLSTYGENSSSQSTYYYPVDPEIIPYHKLVFSPHTTQFEEYYVIDSLKYNQSNITGVNNFRWGYLSKNHAVIPSSFGAFYHLETCPSNPGCTLVDQAEYSEGWFRYFVNYMAEKKLPGSFYWAINGSTEDCVTDINGIDHCYEQSLLEPLDWMQEKEYKTKDYAVMFGQVNNIVSSAGGGLYSPRDGTTYSFPANSICTNCGVVVYHTAHWAGEDYLTISSADYVEYASDVLAAKDDFDHLKSILHEFKVTCKDQNNDPITIAANDFTITVEYTDNELGAVNEEFLCFFKYNALNGWVKQDLANVYHDQINNEITLTTDEFGIYAVLGLGDGDTETQTLTLPDEWSLWSTYLFTLNQNLSTVFASQLPNNLIIIKNGAGQVYWPVYNLNIIGDYVVKESYQIKMASAATVYITGVRIIPEAPSSSITIPVDWSIIGYLRTTPADIGDMLSNILGSAFPYNIAIVKNGDGLIYWPYQQNGILNTIGNMIPGEGYQIKMNSQQYLTYQENLSGTKQGSQVNNKSILAYKNYTQEVYINTDNNMVVGIPYESWGTPPEVGDEIAVLGENNQLVGKTIFQGGFTAITIYGDDFYTLGIVENLSENESFTFEVWSPNTKSIKNYKFVKWDKGDGTYLKNGIDVVAINEVEDPAFIFDFKINPNPGNGQFLLEINSMQKQQLELDVFDFTGKTVYTDELMITEGAYKQKLDLTFLEAGIYTVYLKGKNTSNQTKLIIIK
ncbi:MAG: cellulase family glycosylhydrolase [Bacteroidales bacterium]|nr:cellulase family glycosylhydrolase [Bacteroidales bacterium]MCF8456352.1 cellulase family glycosylhydrolase [Bacteroidales bacterium]